MNESSRIALFAAIAGVVTGLKQCRAGADTRRGEMAEEAISDDGTGDGSEGPSSRLPLGALLIAAGHLTEAKLAEALHEGSETGERIGEVVVRRGWATEDEIARLLAEQWQLGYVERSSIFFDADALGRLTREEAQRLEALPTRVQDGRVVVAVA
ncbi:MAG TPA: hypothetical protein VFO81_00490, partial [Gaiellaceae bacterium]|nr:hypothetical protein [Gaiellaceae bacterium]